MFRDAALVYVRVSRLDTEERERKLSPAMQREKALALRELGGLQTIEFADLDISGKDTAHRPQYLAMLERLTAGDVRYVVAYDLSRITRSVRDQADFFDTLHRHGALFIESQTGRTIDPTDEDEELGANVLGSVNQHYRRKTARRVRDTLATKVARGELVGPVPAGYVRRKEILPSGAVARTWVEPDPERAPIIQTIFREYATGRYSLRSLARELNDRGVRPPRSPHFNNGQRPSELFTADVLKDIIGNPRYAGRVPRRDGAEFVARYPALVDEATWAACAEIRHAGRSVKLSTAPRRPSHYLLSGLLRCAICGSSMSGQTRKPDPRHPHERATYICYRRRVGGSCAGPIVWQDRLERELFDVLGAAALPSGFAETVDAAVAAYADHRGTASRADTADRTAVRMARLRDLYELGDLTRDDYVTRRDELARQKHDLDAEAEPVFMRQRTALRTLVDDWDAMSVDEKRRMVALVFSELVVDGDGIRELEPHDDWKPYMSTVLVRRSSAGLTERKTGLEPATLTLAR